MAVGLPYVPLLPADLETASTNVPLGPGHTGTDRQTWRHGLRRKLPTEPFTGQKAAKGADLTLGMSD
jgi:hypothetical protein